MAVASEFLHSLLNRSDYRGEPSMTNMRSKTYPTLLTAHASITALLGRITLGKTLLQFRKRSTVFSQGDVADSLYFVESGRIKTTVISAEGKEAVLAVLGCQNFVGEECLIGECSRLSSATTIEPATLLRIDKKAMIAAFDDPKLSRTFIRALVGRNMDIEESLSNQLLNCCEKRLARVLLRLARLERASTRATVRIRRVSHEILAEMVGTTRPHITRFMMKFKRLGLIRYDGDLVIQTSALKQIL